MQPAKLLRRPPRQEATASVGAGNECACPGGSTGMLPWLIAAQLEAPSPPAVSSPPIVPQSPDEGTLRYLDDRPTIRPAYFDPSETDGMTERIDDWLARCPDPATDPLPGMREAGLLDARARTTRPSPASRRRWSSEPACWASPVSGVAATLSAVTSSASAPTPSARNGPAARWPWRFPSRRSGRIRSC